MMGTTSDKKPESVIETLTRIKSGVTASLQQIGHMFGHFACSLGWLAGRTFIGFLADKNLVRVLIIEGNEAVPMME